MREWFTMNPRAEIMQWVAEARRYSIELEWLADKMRDLAVATLTEVPHEALRKLLNDALSEVEWDTLAEEYYNET